jgi:hypothetical protein
MTDLTIDDLKYQTLQLRLELATKKMIDAIDEVNDIKCQLWKIDSEKILKNDS